MTKGIDTGSFVQSVRDVLSYYGRDYAIGAVRGLAVRNMISVKLPDPVEGFYPIDKIHMLALKDLEEMFYAVDQLDDEAGMREKLILSLVDGKVWE